MQSTTSEPATASPATILHPSHWASLTPERPAVIFGFSGTVITYGQLVSQSRRCAQFLHELGLRPGDRIALLMENHPAFLEITWAAQDSGLIFTPISWRFHADEIAFILGDCGAQILFVSAAQAHFLTQLTALYPHLTIIAAGGAIPGCRSYEDELARQPATPVENTMRGWDMVYSSGSTGRPKGVKQKVANIGLAELPRIFAVYREKYGWDETTTYLLPAPLYHSGPLRFAMSMQHAGATLILMERFDAAKALELCEHHRVTHAHLVPTMLVRLLKLPATERAGRNLSALRIIIHGAGPIAPDIKREMINWVGPILEESYGGTEGNGLTMISSREWLEHPGSVGRPFVGAVHIIGENGEDLPAYEQGLVYFSGGPAFEYHGAPEKTAEAYDTQGRSTLGDIGYLDADGYLYLTDRKNHKIVTGGVNVYPQEIENILITHPAVLDVAAFGLPDIEMGEIIQAVVQPRDIAQAGSALAAELIEFCRARLAHFKAPKRIDFRAELPRHDTGKIYTRLLKQEYLAREGK